MSLYQSIELKALEIGCTSDFLLIVCFWLVMIFEALLFVVCFFIVRWCRKGFRLLRNRYK